MRLRQRKNAVNAEFSGELLQRFSCFHEQLKEKRETSETVIDKTFTAIDWLARQEITNEKLLPLIDLTEFLGVKELKCFEYRISTSIRESDIFYHWLNHQGTSVRTCKEGQRLRYLSRRGLRH